MTWEEPDGKREVRWAPIRDDGWVRFVALPPDRALELWADAEVNRRLVRASSLKPGESERRIEPEEVKDVAGKVRASQALLERGNPQAEGPLPEHRSVEVFALPSGLEVAETRVENDGSSRVRGLPPGTYRVSVALYHGDLGHPPKSKRVDAGTTDLVIDLE